MRSPAHNPVRFFTILAIAAASLSVFHAAIMQGTAPDATQEIGGHMAMTALRPLHPGDRKRADAIVAAARKAALPYTDYRKALADGYTVFLPDVPQNVYHFTLKSNVRAAALDFDPARPTSLLYEKVPAAKPGEQAGYKLVGVMYTAPYRLSEDDLNQRIPLSIAQWHVHTNLCMPPDAQWSDVLSSDPRFGLRGSITTASACDAAGGRFRPHFMGWMVHVYPFEANPAKIWSAGMNDRHGMQHDAMPPMTMGSGKTM